VDAALAGLLGTAVGAVAGLGGSYLTSTMGRAADAQSWRRTKTEEAYTSCIRAMLQVLDMRSELVRNADASGAMTAVLSHEDQPKYLAAVIDMRYWLSVVMIFASARSRTVLEPVEKQLALQYESLFRGAALEHGGYQTEAQTVIRSAYQEVIGAARRDVGLFAHD
jgi:hypothetical protein